MHRLIALPATLVFGTAPNMHGQLETVLCVGWWCDIPVALIVFLIMVMLPDDCVALFFASSSLSLSLSLSPIFSFRLELAVSVNFFSPRPN